MGAIRPLVNAALEQLSGQFDTLYANTGRTSIAPGNLLRALLLQAFYGVRSERQLMESFARQPCWKRAPGAFNVVVFDRVCRP